MLFPAFKLTVLILNLFRSYPQYAGYAFIVGEGLRIVLALILMVTVFAVHADSPSIPAFPLRAFGNQPCGFFSILES